MAILRGWLASWAGMDWSMIKDRFEAKVPANENIMFVVVCRREVDVRAWIHPSK
jgi:hypothetical protein